MIISVAIVTGFQREITNKVTGFDAHLKVVSLLDESDQYNKLIIDHALLGKLKEIKGVKKIQIFSQQPGIIEFNKEIQGVVIKGVDKDFNRDFFEKYLKEGKLPEFKDADNHEILLSSLVADKLGFKVGQKIRVYFVNKSKAVSPRNFTVTGIYKTGLDDFDGKMVFVSLPELQKVKNYGLQTYIKADTLGISTVLNAVGFGGDKQYNFTWSNGWKGAGPHVLTSSDKLSVIITDDSKTLADTAFFDPSTSTASSAGGSDKYYADGYDIFIDDFKRLREIEEEVYTATGNNLTTTNVVDDNPVVFNWLELLDYNVYIIIILLGVVAIINMCSALLILILERANMIGILKALGARNFSIRKIFLYNGVLLISRGLLWGNLLALGLLSFQYFTGFFTLPEGPYYIKEVPVNFNLMAILLLNLGTIAVSMLVLLLPSLLIAKLSPAKTIRFE